MEIPSPKGSLLKTNHPWIAVTTAATCDTGRRACRAGLPFPGSIDTRARWSFYQRSCSHHHCQPWTWWHSLGAKEWPGGSWQRGPWVVMSAQVPRDRLRWGDRGLKQSQSTPRHSRSPADKRPAWREEAGRRRCPISAGESVRVLERTGKWRHNSRPAKEESERS